MLVVLGRWSDPVLAEEPGPAQSIPVVLELFTSQGCSSCPPADALLIDLTASNTLGVQIIPLAYHVDYWDALGWKDPFSQPQWTHRQRQYAQATRSGVYTPQLIINGRHVVVGSNSWKIRNAIDTAKLEPLPGQLSLAVTPPGVDQLLYITVRAELLHEVPADTLDVMVAVFESNLVTHIASGENARMTLHNDFVVRQLVRAISLPGRAGTQREGSVAMKLEPTWDLEHLGIAAFLQNPESLTIYLATVKQLPDA